MCLVIATHSVADSLTMSEETTVEQEQRLERLTEQLRNLAQQPQSVEMMLPIVAARRQALDALIHIDPSSVLQHILTRGEIQHFPEIIQEQLESSTTMTGVVEVSIEDDFHAQTSATRYRLVVDGERYTLHFLAQPPHLVSGSLIRVHGIQIGNHLLVSQQENS